MLYQTLKQPVEVRSFLDPLRDRLMNALTDFDRALPGNSVVSIQHPKGNPERGLFKLTKLDPQPEPQSLGLIKEAVGKRYGMLDLLDVFLEADRLVNFTRHFAHSGTKEIRSREELRPLIILDLFAEVRIVPVVPHDVGEADFCLAVRFLLNRSKTIDASAGWQCPRLFTRYTSA
jgi:hypothetical protein